MKDSLLFCGKMDERGGFFVEETFDFGFAKVKVNITGYQGYRVDRDTGEDKLFVYPKFENIDTGKKTKHSCYQLDLLSDVGNDVEKIKSGNIRGTNFYKHWMKLFLGSDEKYEFMDSDGNVNEGWFVKQHANRENTFYFKVAGEQVEISGYSVTINGNEYSI